MSLLKNQENTKEVYCKTRLLELGITPALNKIQATFEFYDDFSTREIDIFNEGINNSIEITYIGINGVKTYFHHNKERIYSRIRKHPSQCTNKSPKYITPKGAGIEIFIPPIVLEAYHKAETINTLVITEGEFKAFKGSMHGLYCIGTQGIHNIHEKDKFGNNVLNLELVAIMQMCQVKNVIFLLDNDCLSIEYEEGKDLFKRPNSFYTAVRNFREYSKTLNVDVYFAHINTELTTKGLDDLLVSNKGIEHLIIDDLLSFRKKSDYFSLQNITDKSLLKLRNYFHISNPQEFYDHFEDVILDKVFCFNGYYYQCIDGKLEELVNAEIKRFKRVGDDYYKEIFQPDKTGKIFRLLVKRSKQTIIDDYGKKALKHIAKYEDFCLVPSHTNYQQEYNQFFNKYYPLNHSPQAGTIENILKLIQHVFGETHFEFALDWLQLLYTDPIQALPILILESNERGTGKSTFAEFVLKIFGYNGVKLGQSDLASDFNSIWVERILVVIDEANIDKSSITELLKRYSTEKGKVVNNTKNKVQFESDFFGKFILCSNHVGESLIIPKAETRFAVFHVPILTEPDIDLLDKIEDEIPAFLHHLNNRTLYHPRNGRMYFDFEVYKTEALNRYFEKNTPKLAKEIQRVVMDSFEMFPKEQTLFFSPSDLLEELSDLKFIEKNKIIKALKEDFRLPEPTQKRNTMTTFKQLLTQTAFSVLDEKQSHRRSENSRFRDSNQNAGKQPS